MGPQPDRTQRSVVVSEARGRPAHSGNRENSSDESVAGLAARKAAARLLAAVVDARTPLDGLTDHENGHPQYKALDLRDRGLVRAILVTALRYRMTISGLLARRRLAAGHVARHLLQRGDAVVGVRVGRKQAVHALDVKGIDDEEMRGRGVAFGIRVADAFGAAGDLVKR